MFIFPRDKSYGSSFGCYITLHQMLKMPSDRTLAVGNVINFLGEELIPGIRNEVFLLITKSCIVFSNFLLHVLQFHQLIPFYTSREKRRGKNIPVGNKMQASYIFFSY